MAMMGLVQQLTFNSMSIRFDDASLTNKIIDYVAKTHRDQKPGRLLYEESDLFSMLDTTQIKTECNNPKHEKYLKNMGFVKNGNDWIKSKSFKKQ